MMGRFYVNQTCSSIRIDGYLKDGDGDGNSQPHKGVKASANSDVMYSFSSAQDGDPLQDDVRLCLGDDLKKAQDHSQRQAKITLRVEEERIVFTSVKPASSLIKRVYMLSLRERMELDLEARLMGETLVLNRSLDPFFEDYIKLNDLNEPFELRRNQGDDLMPTIEEGKVIEEFKTRDDELDTGIDDYPSYCDYDKKIHIDFLENMHTYRDEGMGDVIFGEPFLREVGIKTRRFEGMITITKWCDHIRGPRERNINEYWWRIYKSGDLEVLES
ncbi:hypothetical protein Tco_1367971 [Tanacetum coccineum]